MFTTSACAFLTNGSIIASAAKSTVRKKAALIMTYADNSPEKEGIIINHYNVLLNYLGWQDAGQIIAPGVWPVGAVNHTAYPRQAYELGKSLTK